MPSFVVRDALSRRGKTPEGQDKGRHHPESKPVIPLELRGVIMAETRRMLKILLPIVLTTAISDSFLMAAISDILSAPVP